MRPPPVHYPLVITDAEEALRELGADKAPYELTDSAWVLWAHSMGGKKRSAEMATWVKDMLPGGMPSLVSLTRRTCLDETGQVEAKIFGEF